MARKKANDTKTARISPAENVVVDQSNLFPMDRPVSATGLGLGGVTNDFGMSTGGEGAPKPPPKPPEPVQVPPVQVPNYPPAGVPIPTTPPPGAPPRGAFGAMPPADPDDFFSPENLRIAQEFAPPPDSATFAVDVRKPPKDQYIMAHPDPAFSMVWPIIEVEETVYVVHPVLAKSLQSDATLASSVKAARIVLCSIHRGPFFVWVVKQPADPTKKSAMHVALDQCLGFAMAGWTRITWSEDKRQHEAFPLRMENPPTPTWPNKTFPEILKTAFGDARMIKTADHPVIRKLSGLEL